MKYINLGSSDIKVSHICLGTMTFGQQNTEEEAWQQIDLAFERGVNFMDTAEMYPVPANKNTQGKTEEYIGTYFKKNKNREKWIVATKATGPGIHVAHIADNLGFSAPRLKDAIHKSLKRLHTDYIDLYQLHWPERPTNCFGRLGYPVERESDWIDNFEEVLHTLFMFRKEGLIREWGLSNETPWGLMRALNTSNSFENFKPVTIQNPYNLLNRTFEVGLSEMSLRENVGLLAYSPLAFGLLSGKYHNQTSKPENRLNQFPQMARYNSNLVYDVAAKYLQIANESGISPVLMSLAYILNRPFANAAIVGATDLQQLDENLSVSDFHLSGDIFEKIEAVHKEHSNPAP